MRPEFTAFSLLVFAAACSADTFTHKRTGETVEGSLLTRTEEDGKPCLSVKLADGSVRFLPSADWAANIEQTKTPRPPKERRRRQRKSKYLYLGKPRSEAWFSKAYEEFRDKIVVHEGRFIESGKALLLKSAIWDHPPEIGSLRWAICGSPFRTAKILQAVKEDEALVSLSVPGFRTQGLHIVFHVKGVDPAKNLDGTDFPDVPLVYVGKFTYTSAMGAKRTVQSYTVYHPLTREQFKQALDSGLTLTRYTKTTEKVRRKEVVGSGFNVHTVWRTEEVHKINERPVR